MFKALRQLFCSHRETLFKKKFDEDRGAVLYTECLHCGHESPGVETGGFTYHQSHDTTKGLLNVYAAR